MPDARYAQVSVVCQYGILGIGPGVARYTQAAIRALRDLEPDLTILSGGGPNGAVDYREAESVAEAYRDHLPDQDFWLEKYSRTTFENLSFSLAMLAAAGVVPKRLTVLADATRQEKVRLAMWVLRRRRDRFRGSLFDVLPIERPALGWRDRRAIQASLGTLQMISECLITR